MNACSDTGTMRTIISNDLIKRNGLKTYKMNEHIFAANGDEMACEGKVPFKIHIQGRVTPVLALVSLSMTNEMFFSMNEMKAMGVLRITFPNMYNNKIEVAVADMDNLHDKIKKDYADVFGDKLSQEPMYGHPMIDHLQANAKPT